MGWLPMSQVALADRTARLDPKRGCCQQPPPLALRTNEARGQALIGARTDIADVGEETRISEMKKFIAGFAPLVLLVGCAGDGGPTRFEQAYQDCEATSEGVVVDEGKTALLTLDTEREEKKQLLDDSLCVFNSFDPPQSVQSHILSTSNLDGFQEAEWDGISAQWRYHRDLGIVITLVETEK